MLKTIVTFSAKNRFLIFIILGFLLVLAWQSLHQIPVDALPDLSDTQVIIYSKWDKSPDIIEDQVTYPIISALLGAPQVKAIRGFSDFGFSYVYVIFDDNTDMYWARSRTLEYLSKISSTLPEGVKTELGPPATGLGWVYEYALVDESGKNNLSDLRSLEDWDLRYQLQSVPGVAEVASLGGQVKQYQVIVNPLLLQNYHIPFLEVTEAITKNNSETGGRVLEIEGHEFMIRGRGYLKSEDDIKNIAIGRNPTTGAPLLIKDIGEVTVGPDMRRGVAELDGKGETVGGIIIMRSGENALEVIQNVKKRIAEILPSLPEGIKIVPVYDRSDLILRALATLKKTLLDEMIIVSLVIMLFLWHIPSALVAITTIPIAVLLSFIFLKLGGITSNIMSLAGIAISIGVLVDGAIVEVENSYQKIEKWKRTDKDKNSQKSFESVRLESLIEVAPAVFFSLLIIAVSFLPIFTLTDQEGRLFKPLAYSKTIAMAIAALLAITLDPAFRMMFTRHEFFPEERKNSFITKIINTVFVGKYYPEENHPISRILFKIYEPICRFSLKNPKKIILTTLALFMLTLPLWTKLGSEFMPPLNEGSLLYMPTTLPSISATAAKEALIKQDALIKNFPEVERVFGKIGRADTSTDPAPLSMAETTIVLKPQNEWPKINRFYSNWPTPFKNIFRFFISDQLSSEELVNQMNTKINLAHWTNAWTMPIKNRIDMLSTGIRTPLGIKIFGNNLMDIEQVGKNLETLLRTLPETRSVFAEKTSAGFFIDFDLKRDQLARFGLSVDDANQIISSAIGGENLTTTVEGRERYSVNVRLARDFRNSLEDFERLPIITKNGEQIPLEAVANIHINKGPAMIRNEDGLLSGYVYIDVEGSDLGHYVEIAQKKIAQEIHLPIGTTIRFSGQFENMVRVRERLKTVLPLTLLLIFILLFMNTRSLTKTLMVLLAVPFSLIGALWMMALLHYHLSIASWVGMIALMGLDAETGVFMLLFLDLSYNSAKKENRLNNFEDLTEAVIHGAVKRVRPKMMTVTAALMGLLPILFSNGTGSDVMKRIAAPMIGGLITSFALELLIYPVLYLEWKKFLYKKNKI